MRRSTSITSSDACDNHGSAARHSPRERKKKKKKKNAETLLLLLGNIPRAEHPGPMRVRYIPAIATDFRPSASYHPQRRAKEGRWVLHEGDQSVAPTPFSALSAKNFTSGSGSSANFRRVGTKVPIKAEFRPSVA